MEVTTKTLQQEIISTLPYFSGSSNYFEHKTFGYGFSHLTEGAAYIRDKCNCYWLFDLMLSFKHKLQGESFVQWDLSQAINGTWVIAASDGNGNTLASQDIKYSDFPLAGVVLWMIDNVVMLPSEY